MRARHKRAGSANVKSVHAKKWLTQTAQTMQLTFSSADQS